jgi:hypothetical protein
MKTFIGILLVGLLGFSGCSSSDAESSPAYNVQAIGMVKGSELSVSAHVIDQEEQLSSDAMITINGEPMNIGFFVAEDLNIDQDDSLPDDNNPTAQEVPSGDFQPFYFLDSFDLNEVDTVNFVARGRNGTTLLTSSNVVPEKLTLIEPSSEATFHTGQEVYIKWQGADPYECFEVSYSWGSEDESYSTGWLQDTYDYTIGTGVINEAGPLFIFVRARSCAETQEDDGGEVGTSYVVYEVIAATVRTVDDRALQSHAGGHDFYSCRDRARRVHPKCMTRCGESPSCDNRCRFEAQAALDACKQAYCNVICR